MKVLFALFLSLLAGITLAAEPLVIVVHGIGGGNRDDGWSHDIAKRWSVQTHEVTYRQVNRNAGSSFTDFARNGGDWAKSVQGQIKDLVAKNPGRRVVIVSHSWGTVATKLALDGGNAGGTEIAPINLNGAEVEEWVTLGSPLGRADNPEIAFNLRQLGVNLSTGRPKVVKHWTNFFDPDDPVSNQSHDLAGADNVEVSKSGYWADVTGMTYHTGIWQNPKVNQYIWDQFIRITNLPPLPPKPGPGGLRPIDSSVPDVVAEYRRLLPQHLQANKKPWHTRIELIRNAEPQGSDRYRVNWATWCLIEKGPDTGKDYLCFENDTVMSLGQIGQAVGEMKAAGRR